MTDKTMSSEMRGNKRYRDALDRQLEGNTSVAEVIKDLPLYDQILNRGQLMGKMMSRNLIEVVRQLAHEVNKLQSSEFREVELHGNTIDQRDHAEGMADTLAAAIAKHFRVEIGEHSSMNCPWREADKILNGEYVTDTDEGRELKKVRAQLDWLVNEEAIIVGCDGQYWLEWPKNDERQTLRFNSPEAAIAAATAASDPLREATSTPSDAIQYAGSDDPLDKANYARYKFAADEVQALHAPTCNVLHALESQIPDEVAKP